MDEDKNVEITFSDVREYKIPPCVAHDFEVVDEETVEPDATLPVQQWVSTNTW